MKKTALCVVCQGASKKNESQNGDFSTDTDGAGEPATIVITCDNETNSLTIKTGDTFCCSVGREEFTFEIKNIEENKIEIEANQYGLTEANANGTINLMARQKNFTIKKGSSVELYLQATDISSKITFSYEKKCTKIATCYCNERFFKR